ncbi:MAG: hypothetical protein V9E87_05890 [Gemmatimonadales bacterium]
MLRLIALLAVQGPLLVAPDGPYRSIAAAVAAAPDGGTVRVAAGVWRMPTVHLDRPITLVGDAGAILDGEGTHELLLIRGSVGDGARLHLPQHRPFVSRGPGRGARRQRGELHSSSRTRFDDTFFAIYLARTDGLRRAAQRGDRAVRRRRPPPATRSIPGGRATSRSRTTRSAAIATGSTWSSLGTPPSGAT